MTTRSRVCRIGLLGAGRIGRLHAGNILRRIPRLELAAIADPALDAEWAELQPVALKTTDVDAVIAHPDIDAILIATPTPLHIPQIRAAAAHGKAIYCEKPIGLDEAEVLALMDEINARGTLLHIGFNRRFDPSFAKVAAGVHAGDIGTPQMLCITSRDPACPPIAYAATSGGMLMDMTIHDFDMARFVMQSEVVEVYASGGVLIDPRLEGFGDVDTAIIQLRFANGAIGVINNSRQAVYGYDQRLEVLGSEGMLQAENRLENAVRHYRRNDTGSANPLYFFLERYEQAFVAGLEAFCAAYLDGNAAPVSAEDALCALRIAKAAQESLVRNQPVRVGGDADA